MWYWLAAGAGENCRYFSYALHLPQGNPASETYKQIWAVWERGKAETSSVWFLKARNLRFWFSASCNCEHVLPLWRYVTRLDDEACQWGVCSWKAPRFELDRLMRPKAGLLRYIHDSIRKSGGKTSFTLRFTFHDKAKTALVNQIFSVKQKTTYFWKHLEQLRGFPKTWIFCKLNKQTLSKLRLRHILHLRPLSNSLTTDSSN